MENLSLKNFKISMKTSRKNQDVWININNYVYRFIKGWEQWL
jgi:hypothetical protein